MNLATLSFLVILNCGARWAVSGGWLECVATDGCRVVSAGEAQSRGLGGPTSTRRRLQITGSPNLQLPKHPGSHPVLISRCGRQKLSPGWLGEKLKAAAGWRILQITAIWRFFLRRRIKWEGSGRCAISKDGDEREVQGEQSCHILDTFQPWH